MSEVVETKPNPLFSLLNAEEADPKATPWNLAFSDTETSEGDSESPPKEEKSTSETTNTANQDSDSKEPFGKSKSATGMCRRKRLGYHQWLQMERFFKVTPHPSKQLRQNLAKSLNLTPHQVQVWFQNRRVKKKHEVKARPLPYAQPNVFIQPNQIPSLPQALPMGIAPGSLNLQPLQKRQLYPTSLAPLFAQNPSPSYFNSLSEVAVAEQLLNFREMPVMKMNALRFPDNNINRTGQNSVFQSSQPRGLSVSDPAGLRLPFASANGNPVLPPPWK